MLTIRKSIFAAGLALALAAASHAPADARHTWVDPEKVQSASQHAPPSHCSPGSTAPLPQDGAGAPQGPQSAGQVLHFSCGSQTPLPHVGSLQL